MKYLVLLLVLVVVIGIWRGRRTIETRRQYQGPRQSVPQDMLACAHCGVHIPKADALLLGTQAYCCDEHRRLGPH
jgi:uncharacterized protein